MKSTTDKDGYITDIQIFIPPAAYKIESLNNEIIRNVIDKSHYSGNEYPFTIKPIFSTLGSIIETSPKGPIISFLFDGSIRDLLGFHAITLYKEHNLSANPVDFLSFDSIFL